MDTDGAFLRCSNIRYFRGLEHIFDENAVTRCRVVYHNVGHRADELAVLNDGRARQ